jgi:hypothetical protein
MLNYFLNNRRREFVPLLDDDRVISLNETWQVSFSETSCHYMTLGTISPYTTVDIDSFCWVTAELLLGRV